MIMGPVVGRDSGVDFHVMWMYCSLLNHSPADEHRRFPVFVTNNAAINTIAEMPLHTCAGTSVR